MKLIKQTLNSVGIFCLLTTSFLSVSVFAQSYWTNWHDRDNPSGTGDWENITAFEEDGVVFCPDPFFIAGIEARRISDGLAANLTGEIFSHYNVTSGFVCQNQDQPDNTCFDYEVRFFCDEDLAVELASFTLSHVEHRVYLDWVTGAEIDNLGFRVWRGQRSELGDYESILLTPAEPTQLMEDDECSIKLQGQINAPALAHTLALIPTVGDVTTQACYSFEDVGITEEGSYYYLLEDLDKFGTRRIHCQNIQAVTVGQGLTPDIDSAQDACRNACLEYLDEQSTALFIDSNGMCVISHQ